MIDLRIIDVPMDVIAVEKSALRDFLSLFMPLSQDLAADAARKQARGVGFMI